MPNSSVPKAVPSAVAPSAQNTVPIMTKAQLGPYKGGPYSPMHGRRSVNPKVPRTEVDGEKDMLPNPKFGGQHTKGMPRESGDSGAPTVPLDGYLFKKGPIDNHYTSEYQGNRNPYRRINHLRTVGWWTRIQDFQNRIATSQDTDNAGWKVRHDQQRTSVMRNQLPANGKFGTQTYIPRYRPQSPATYKYMPSTGTDPYGTGVLNSDTFGAGQTAGGIGGNQYTPTPGPPATSSTANNGGNINSGMPTWG